MLSRHFEFFAVPRAVGRGWVLEQFCAVDSVKVIPGGRRKAGAIEAPKLRGQRPTGSPINRLVTSTRADYL